MNTKRLWIGFIAVMVVSFAILGYYGFEVYFQKPPIPDRVVSDSGEQLFTGNEIVAGQNVWQSIGGQEVGSIWGHGAYVAPDWSADWLHREAVYMLNRLAFTHDSCSYDELDSERQAYLQLLLQKDLRNSPHENLQ